MGSPPLRHVLRLALLTALVLCALPSTAFAGRIWVTGHDQDFHCSGGQGCGYVRAALAYVRADAPDPSKPVLVLDRGGLAVPAAFDNVHTSLGAPVIPRTVVDPRSTAFRTLPISTSRYSAVVVASDTTCGGCDLNEFSSTPDSDAIFARRGAIQNFVNEGGGVLAFSGASHGDGTKGTGDKDNYYAFIPTAVGGTQVAPPFCLTALGRSLGLNDVNGCPAASLHFGSRDDINCCPTHNSFKEPDFTSPLRIAEIDLGMDHALSKDDHPETLVAGGRFSGGQIVLDLPAPKLGRSVNVDVVKDPVYVKQPRRGHKTAFASKGSGFVRLRSPRQIRVGSLLDTRRGGVVALYTATTHRGRQQVAQLSGSIFQVVQSRRRRARGLATLVLKGGSFRSCGARGATVQAARHRRIRRLRARARGRFRTRGRYSAATVRGTEWVTDDRCDGTLTTVRRGTVIVRDFKRHRNIRVRAGHRYLARK